jgi:hypothetical protein
MACTGSTLLSTLTGYILSDETADRLGAWPVLMYYPVIFLNGLGRAVKICIDVQRRHVAILLISFLYSLSYFKLHSMKSGYTISRSNTWLNKTGNVRATIVAVEKQ